MPQYIYIKTAQLNQKDRHKVEEMMTTNYHVIKDKVDTINYDTKDTVKEFDYNYYLATEEIKDLKEHNDIFTIHYKKYGKRVEEKRKRLKHIETPFKDLIRKYNDKGYRIPNLSVKSNLFEPSPMLLEINEIKEFYKFNTVGDGECKFLEKVNNAVIDRVNNIDIPKLVKKNNELGRRFSLRSRPVCIQNLSDLKKEHDSLRTDIDKAYKTIEHTTINYEEEKNDLELIDSTRKRRQSSGSVYKTIELMNKTPSQGMSTNYGSMSFSPRYADAPQSVSSFRNNNFAKNKTKPFKATMPLVNKPVKQVRNIYDFLKKINAKNKQPVSRNPLPQGPQIDKYIHKKLNSESQLNKFKNNQYSYIDHIYNRTKENTANDLDTERMLKTYYKTFYKSSDEEIMQMFHSK
jgi:hypothetical protein